MIDLVTNKEIDESICFEINKIRSAEIREFFVLNFELFKALLSIFDKVNEYENSNELLFHQSQDCNNSGDTLIPLVNFVYYDDVIKVEAWSRRSRINIKDPVEAINYIIKNQKDFKYD